MATIECPRCRGKIDPRATRCQHCQADFTADEIAMTASAAKGSMSGWIVFIVIVLVLMFMLGPRSSDDAETAIADIQNISSTTATDVKNPPQDEQTSDWTYTRRRDELRNGEIVEARIRSANSTALGFPYGTVHLNIMVREHPEWGRDVIFVVDEGQILCRYDDCSGMINFDGKPERLTLNESADNDSSVVFAAYAPAIIRKLQNSQKVIVELPFYQNGNRQFTFDTGDLEWPPKHE